MIYTSVILKETLKQKLFVLIITLKIHLYILIEKTKEKSTQIKRH